jgi:hypothetical protein
MSRRKELKMKVFSWVVLLVVLLSVMAAPVMAGGGAMVGGVGVSHEAPQMPQTIWGSLTAIYCGQEVAELASDTPITYIGPRHQDVSYRVRVQTTNLPHVEWAKVFVNQDGCPTHFDGKFYIVDIPSIEFIAGANKMDLQVHGKFGTTSINLVFFAPKWRTHEDVMGSITVHMTDTNDPMRILASRGWITLRDFTPSSAPPAPADTTCTLPTPCPANTGSPASTTCQTSVVPTVGPADMAPNPAAIRFFVDNVEITGWVSTRPGERLIIVTRTGAGSLYYEEAGGGKTAAATTATPGTTIFPIVVPCGDTILTVTVGQDTAQLVIKGVE